MSTRVEELTRRSQYIFEGVIEQLGASTISQVEPTEQIAVVRVESVLEAPETIDDFTDREVTVALETVEGAKEGQRAVFFTTSWIYGESLALIEVGRVPARDVRRQRKQIHETKGTMSNEDLQDRLRRALLVVVGRVLSTQPVRERRRGPITEHAPAWWGAVLEVESAEKGRMEGEGMTVLFPRSSDEVWIDSPKFEPGQEGIWILQRDQKELGMPILRLPGLTALNPLDFQPKYELERIRALLEGMG